MHAHWRPIQFRIYDSQLTPLLARLEQNGRHAIAGSEMHRDTIEFGLMDADSTHAALFDRARTLRYSIYPGRRLGISGAPATYWTPAFWQAEVARLERQISLMGDDRRLMLDIEAYNGTKLTWSAFTNGVSAYGSLVDLRALMAPYLRLLASYCITVLVHPASLDQVLFTEIADAVGGRLCAQFETTYGDAPLIYRDDSVWKRKRHELASLRIAPLLRRYPEARISLGCYDTILRKYWFGRLAQLSSTEHGHVFIDDQYRLDWSSTLGEQTFFDCTSTPYNMNEGVVEAYHFHGNTDHLPDVSIRGQQRFNVAVGHEDRKQIALRCDGGYTHSGAISLEVRGRNYLIGGGTRRGLGYERALATPGSGSGFLGAPFALPRFTLLLDFYLSDLAGLTGVFGRRSPLVSVWGSASHGQRWFRVYFDSANQYVFEVVEQNNGAGRARVTIGAGAQDDRRRRLQITYAPGSISIAADGAPAQQANVAFQPRGDGTLVFGFERHADAPEGDYYFAKGLALEQCVIWDRVVARVPTGTYPFMEPQV